MLIDQNTGTSARTMVGQSFEGVFLNVGSHEDNEVTISGKGILPFHLLVAADATSIKLIPLAQGAGYRIGDTSYAAAGELPLTGGVITIGDRDISMRQGEAAGTIRITVSRPRVETNAEQPAAPISYSDDVILANLLSQNNNIQVEQSAEYALEIVNAGPIVAGFAVAISGVPTEWVDVSPASFNLNEGRRVTVTIKITPPRHFSSSAGTHHVKALITSPNYPGYQVSSGFDLIIQPFYDFGLGNLEPRQQNITWARKVGRVKVPMTNLGNSESTFSVLALDDENGINFDLKVRDDLLLSRQASFPITPGTTLDLPISITPHKQPIFSLSSHRYQYTAAVSVTEGGPGQQVVSGSVNVKPLFGWWSIVLGVLAILLAAFVILQPRINSYQIAGGKDIIEQGDTTQLVWMVSPFATRINISNVDKTITYGQNSLTVAPATSTTYELTTGNWLSGLLGLDQHQSQTVLVIPPKPTINVFEVDTTAVPRGKELNLRWSVTQADKAVLNIGGVVTELASDKFSGSQSVLLDKDAIVTLEASNASGAELKSYYVNVVDPFITVRTFTVWVRPLTTASIGTAEPKTPHNASISPNTPEASDSFTEKYVELVADASSELGYRVQFYQPERELTKGEQVMIEWNILGTDTDSVQIAPFTEVLPNNGRQPFFPQESMNFVLSAQSGDEKKIYMLPVVVFDGEPPVAPKIDIFKASPLSMVGPGSTQFAWSVSGEWTRINLQNGKGVVADYLNPQGFKTVNVGNSDTFILTAWNGELTSSMALDITVNPALIQPGLVITEVTPTTGRFMVGGKITVTVGFDSIPSDKPNPTGAVTVTDGNAICTIPLPAMSCDLYFKTSGTKTITASFPGDAIYMQSNAPGFSQQIEVASAQVELIPSYYFKGGATPVAVETTDFELDKGMDIIVEVRPKNTLLADDNGNVAVSLCEQDSNGVLQLSTCEFVGSAKVMVAQNDTLTETAGYGYSHITLQYFNGTGLRAFLFEYTHADNAIDPASATQSNVVIRRPKLLLGFTACDNALGLIGCSYGLASTDPTKMIFDLYLPGTPDPILLSSLLPAPQASAFSITSVPAATWDCTIGVNSGTHKLVCWVTGLVPGDSYSVTYQYDNSDPLPSTFANNYYMGGDEAVTPYSSTFSLDVLNSTKTQIGSLSGIHVGERIYLTGDQPGALISVLDPANTPIATTGGLTLEAKSGDDVFGVEDEGLNCVRDGADPNKIVVSAANSNCYIYFKHTGSYTIQATFEGDDENNGSMSGEIQVTVQKQSGIVGTMKYFNTGNGQYAALPSSWTVNKAFPLRLELTGPNSSFSNPDVSFPPSALIDRWVLVNLGTWTKNNCTVTEDSSVVLDSEGVYAVKVSQKVVGDPANGDYVTSADLTIKCSATDALGVSFNVFFSDKTDPKDSDDFAFATPVTVSNISINVASLGSMTVSIKREDSATTNMLPNAAPGSAINKLHFGQLYDVSISSSSNITVPYTYTVDYTNTYYYVWTWNGLWWNWVLTTNFPSVSGVSASTSTRNSILSTYQSKSKWSVDPSNFLTLGTNLAQTPGSTCASNMSLSVANHTSTSPGSEYYGTSLLSVSYDYSTFTRTYYYHYRRTYYGSMLLSVSSPSACKMAFDSTTALNTAVTATNGTISISASTDTLNPLFNVINTYSVNGIDKQLPNAISFSPATPAAKFTNTNLPITASLSSSEITGGTSLPFVDTAVDFATQFTPAPASYTGTCAGLTRADALNTTGVVQTFRSTLPIASTSSCNLTLTYRGNKYYKVIGPNNLPAMTFLEPAGVSLAASPASSAAFGDTVTLTATTNPSALAGYVTFKDGSTTLATVAVTSGSAQTSISTLSIAGSPHSLTAVFTPTDTTNYSAVTSSAVSYTITKAATSTSLNGSASSGTYGTNVTFTATVTPSSLAGTVVFKDGATNIGSQAVSSGSAVLSFDNLSVAGSPHSITAVFTPTNTNYDTSTSSAVTYTASTATSTTTLSASPVSPSVYGNSVTFTATVPTKASGSVAFKDGATLLGTETVSSGTATFAIASLDNVSSPHSITAVFTPDNTNFSGSTSSALSYTVNKATTTTGIVVLDSPTTTPIQNSANLQFSVSVTSSSAAIPLGTVEFFKNGTTSLGTVTITTGTSTVLNYSISNVKLTPAGTYTVTAVFTPATTNMLGSDSSATPLTVVTE